ncbi:MAG TPA: carboxypeptidase-like regulatory domain-containing protein [Candidatus Sulfotelmatobacter sp.]|nr:carboxypeptidase-like regulatory domain-containing protein [Candidatus Sulfotelmatobacter sp.]
MGRVRSSFTTGVLAVGVLVLLFGGPAAKGQSTFGSLRGLTLDATGSAIPSAEVTLIGLDDNSERKAISGDAGLFEFLNLKAGRYRLAGKKPGFADAGVPEFALEARQELRLNLTFSVASQAQTVVVSELASHINTENGTIDSTLENLELTQLPLNSRAVSSSPLAALALSPDVVKDSQGNFAVGGATSAQTGFSVDGISTASVRANGALQDAYPSQEGISEMRVTAFNNNAEFAQIGDVTFTTKSGSDQFHGSAFEYFQSDALDSTIYGFPSKAPKTFNTFGGSLGGPAIIPGVWNGRKKNTYFFLDYEGNRKTTSAPEFLLVPTRAERNGNLNNLVLAAAAANPGTPTSDFSVYDPFTGNPYPNNTIPSCTAPGPGGPTDCLNPVTQKLLNAWYPLPNVNQNVIGPAYNYQTLVPIPSNSNGWDLRVDQRLTSKQQIFARYSWKNVFVTESNSAGALAPANNFLPNDQARDQNRSLVVSHNYVLSTNLVNEFRFGFTNYTENDTFPLSGAQADVGTGPGELGLVQSTIPLQFIAQPTGHAFPTFNFLDGTMTNIGQDRVGTTLSKTYQFTDNFTMIKHSHTIRFGFDTRRVLYNALMFYYASDDYGQFNFSGALTGYNPTPGAPEIGGYSFGDFLLGAPQSNFAITGGPQVNAHSWHSGVYGQDQWQVNSHLTVNFGLRWEVQPAMFETNGDLASFDPALNSIVVPDKFFSMLKTYGPATPVYVGVLESYNGCSLTNYGLSPDPSLPCTNVISASQAGLPQGLRHTPLHDFDPRVSIAFRPSKDEKTVIRAGFGLFTMTTLGPMSFNNAMVGVSDLVSYSNPYPVTNKIFQFPDATPLNAAIQYGGGAFEEANNPYWKDATSAQWNLTVERQVTPSTTVRFSYVGQGTWHLPITIDLNQVPASKTPYSQSEAPFPQFDLLMSSESIGNATYEAGIAEVQHRVSHGLTFQANYTFAKNISDAQGSDAPAGFASEEPYAVEIANRYNLQYDRGNVAGTPRQRFLLTGIYQLPVGTGQLVNVPQHLNPLLGGWNFSTVVTMQTGQWLTPTMNAASDQSNTNMEIRNSEGSAVARPDCVGNPVPSNQSRAEFFNINAFSVPPADAGRFGTCGLGILQGPNLINVNAALAKVVHISERYRLRFEASFTNLLNRSNFAPPALNISNPSSFGVLTSVLPQGNGGNRTGQLALRLDF